MSLTSCALSVGPAKSVGPLLPGTGPAGASHKRGTAFIFRSLLSNSHKEQAFLDTGRDGRRKAWRGQPGLRRGSALPLLAFMLVVILMFTALIVDVAYMQLIRTELRVATDASAKAGAEALARLEDEQLAKEAAVLHAERNHVGGKPLMISEADVQVGRVTSNDSGGWDFDPEGWPPNGVRVLGNIAEEAETKPIPLFFGPAIGFSNFSTQQTATAAQQEVEICLVIDRSGSMLFDMSGEDFAYPPNNPYLTDFTAWGWIWRNHLSPPHPSESRWAILASAIDVFFDEAGKYSLPPRTSLVTWASNYTMPIPPSTFYPAVRVDHALPAREGFDWEANVATVRSQVSAYGIEPMMGATNLSAGLDEGVAMLTAEAANPLANKMIVLFTDGQWNDGRDPIEAAHDAADAGITVHTVALLVNENATAQIASITGGQHFIATNEAELRNAFYEIARSLPVVLTH